MKSIFCSDFSEAAVYTETLRPTPGLWGTRILFCLQGVPQVMPLTFSILYAVSYFHLSDLRVGMVETTETKNSWLPVHASCWQALALWFSSSTSDRVDGQPSWSASLVRRLRLFSGKTWRHDLVKFITRMCKVKTQTKYLSLLNYIHSLW